MSTDLESFSKYLNSLSKDGKHSNVIVSFQNTKDNFSKEGIKSNDFIVRCLLDAYRKENRLKEGVEFIKIYDITPVDIQNHFTKNSYGWFLHQCLKEYESQDDLEQTSSFKLSLDFLPMIDLTDDYGRKLFVNLFSKILRIERAKEIVRSKILFQILKAVNFRKNEIAKELTSKDPYSLSWILDIFRKSKEFEWGIKFLRFLDVEINADSNPLFLNSYGWFLFAKLKDEFNVSDEQMPESEHDSFILDFREEINTTNLDLNDNNETENAILGSIEFLFPQSNTKYSPFSKLFHLILKVLNSKPNPKFDEIAAFLERFDPSELSEKCEVMEITKKGRKRTIELASDMELWYMNYTKALFKLEKYQECNLRSKEALDIIDKLHYNNEIWFSRKIALSKQAQGNNHEAIEDIINILKVKREWFIEKELAILYKEENEVEKSLSFAIDAALNFGDIEKKDGVFFLIGEILETMGNPEMAALHFHLCRAIREQEDWKVHRTLIEALERYPSSELKEMSKEEILNAIKPYWRSIKPSNKRESRKKGKRIRGVVQKINLDRGFGFIDGENQKRYFFHISEVRKGKLEIKSGDEVSFNYKPPKKEGMNWLAINIEVVE